MFGTIRCTIFFSYVLGIFVSVPSLDSTVVYPLHNAWKFSAAMGTLSAYSCITIRPMDLPAQEKSKYTRGPVPPGSMYGSMGFVPSGESPYF